MNNLLKITVLFFASLILFTSCKTMSVTKRHYNKGYYVSHSHKKKGSAKTERVETITKTETAVSLSLKKTDMVSVPKEETNLRTSLPNEPVPAPKEKKKLFNRNISMSSGEEIEVKDVIKRPLSLRKALAAKDTGDDALSLLWILIVVLLILYIVGILTEGFGLGGIIHILGVIVLVLLILWLLKLI